MFSRAVASSLLRRAARPAASRAASLPSASAAAPAAPAPFPAAFRLQARLLSDVTRTAIDKAVASAAVVVFMKGTPEFPQCGFSNGIIQLLSRQGVDPEKFAAFNVLEDPDLRQGIKEYSDWPTIPQLYVNSEFVGGFDIVQNLFHSGELGYLLKNKGLLVPGEEPQQPQQ